MKATKVGHGNLEHKKDLAPQPEKRVIRNCIHCSKQYLDPPYGYWGNEGEGTCTPPCERAQQMKPRYVPPHQEEICSHKLLTASAA